MAINEFSIESIEIWYSLLYWQYCTTAVISNQSVSMSQFLALKRVPSSPMATNVVLVVVLVLVVGVVVVRLLMY